MIIESSFKQTIIIAVIVAWKQYLKNPLVFSHYFLLKKQNNTITHMRVAIAIIKIKATMRQIAKAIPKMIEKTYCNLSADNVASESFLQSQFNIQFYNRSTSGSLCMCTALQVYMNT